MLEGIEVLPFQEQYLAGVVSIEEASFPDPWSAQSFAELSKQNDFRIFVAILEKNILGFYVGQLFHPEAELHNIAVHPSFLHKGLGTQMLHHFIKQLHAERFQRLYLLTRVSNESAIFFYKKNGFKTVGLRRNHYKDGENGHIMVLDM